MTGRMSLGTAIAVALCAACELPNVPSDGPAFEPQLFVDGNTRLLYHWPLGRTISIFADDAVFSPDRDLRAAILAGAASWNDAVYYREFEIRLVDDPKNADVIFHFDDAAPIVDTQSCDGVLLGAGGVTYFCLDDALATFLPLPFVVPGSQSRVKFDVTISSDPVKVPTREQFLAIVAHEMGHVLGIASHSGELGDLMFVAPTVTKPSVRDARTLRWLLHQPSDLAL